jgi:hypothetical protein
MQQSDGAYLRASKLFKDAPAFSSQEFLMRLAEGKADLDAIPPAVPAVAAAKVVKEHKAKPIATNHKEKSNAAD